MIDRFKQLIRKNNIRTFFKNYAGTCICILLFTMYAMIFNFEESTYIPTALFFTGVGFFFAETGILQENNITVIHFSDGLFGIFADNFIIVSKNNIFTE